jgi:diguanylate cyclase (GGDEF)-like protein
MTDYSTLDGTAPLILIVDDTPANIQILAEALNGDYRIRFATSGAAALDLARAPDKPDLILLDVLMPGMDGYQICRLLQEDPATRNIPIIFVTAKTGVSDQSYGFSIGAVDYITKPFELAIVRSRVRTHVNLKRKTELLEQLASVDGLTGIPNRRRFDETLQREWRRAARHQSSLALLMIDVDHFKAFNDHYGHGAGDRCLQKVAGALMASLFRPGDFLARYGGEEFAILLPECAVEGARTVAERSSAKVEALGIPHAADSSGAGHVTVSVGCAALVPHSNKDPSALLDAADRWMYLAKQEGRNRIRG